MKPFLFSSILLCSAYLAQASEISASALPRSTPEAQGVSSVAILDFIQTANREVTEMNSFMLLRHGQVVAEGWWTPYSAETPHVLYSLSKSFTSTAVGLAIAEGKLKLEDPVLKFFPEDAPANPTNNNLKAMRVSDLLRMSVGHQTELRLTETNDMVWTKAFLAHPVPHKPGTHFLYNTPATYMQSAILQKATGQTLFDYLRPRLFDPLGIEHPTWDTSPQKISLGGYGLNLRTEDIAKFGQLYLQKGQWHGKQLIPAAWVEAATARQTSNGSNPESDWDQGYGYQFWQCRHGFYRGDGAFGQFCIVMPALDAVVAITSGTRDMQGVMNLIWDKLLPAMGASPLPDNASGVKSLQQALSNLSIRRPQGAATSPNTSSVAGKKFVFPVNSQKLESITLESGGEEGQKMVVRTGGVDFRLTSGHGQWRIGRLAYGALRAQPVAVAGAWTTPDTYTAKFCFHETPTSITSTMKFVDGQLVYDSEYNVAFGPAQPPQLVGRVQ